jgi:hypothetical protein
VGRTAALRLFLWEDARMRNRPLTLPVPLALLLLLLGAPARADEVVLKGGSRLQGVVLKQDDAGVRLLQPGGDEVALAVTDLKEVRRDADAPQGGQVIRYAADPKAAAQGLQVALVHMLHPTTGRRVDLVGAVHIADLAYYREVQRLLEQVDVVLYEMVKPKDAAPEEKPKPGEENSLRDLQKRMAGWLGLAFQLDAISYDRPHFVHGDLTLEEFSGQPGSEDMASRVKPMAFLLKLLDGLMKLAGGGGSGFQRMLKGTIGERLGGMDPKELGAMLGDATMELLIDRRNEACVKCLLEVPATARTVAIFYGAAHLPDLEKRLKAQGYERAGARWLTAWDTSPAKEAPKARPNPAPQGAPAPK